jgi:hypothetical protein
MHSIDTYSVTFQLPAGILMYTTYLARTTEELAGLRFRHGTISASVKAWNARIIDELPCSLLFVLPTRRINIRRENKTPITRVFVPARDKFGAECLQVRARLGSFDESAFRVFRRLEFLLQRGEVLPCGFEDQARDPVTMKVISGGAEQTHEAWFDGADCNLLKISTIIVMERRQVYRIVKDHDVFEDHVNVAIIDVPSF